MAKQLNVNLAFTADTGKAKAQIQDLQNQLTKLVTTTNNQKFSVDLDNKGINEAISSVAELQAHLRKATNQKTGNLDFSKLNDSLKKSNKSLIEYGDSLRQLGPEGQKAFQTLVSSITSAEIPMRRVNNTLNEMWTTMKNTARWQISSSIMHGFMGSVQSAYGYAKRLDESLNNIRIVTGQNTDQMAAFAEKANKAAKALSATTTQYTDAALIYYQQGLNDQEVQDRADITIKMAHASGQSAEIVSDQLTAIWNNFAKGGEDLEHFADVMTALGAATASSSDEIAGGLEKFASIADMIGLSYEYAASALATITATTRQSEDVVGTALKTIFARIQGLKLGETLDDGTDLNKYSEALQKVGISIFEQNGELKDMDNILDEMGAKWETLSKDQQVALAQTVAGVRQYNQLVSLMDGWDFMQENVALSLNSDGTLDEQAEIYAESWEAASNRVRAAAEDIYDSLLDDEFFIALLNGFEDILTVVGKLIDGMGGFEGVISSLGAVLTRVFSTQLAQSLTNASYTLTMMTESGRKKVEEERKRVLNDAKQTTQHPDFETMADKARSEALGRQVDLQSEYLDNVHKMSDIEQEVNQALLERNKLLNEQKIKAAELASEADRKSKDSKFDIEGMIAQNEMDLAETYDEEDREVRLNTNIAKTQKFYKDNRKAAGDIYSVKSKLGKELDVMEGKTTPVLYTEQAKKVKELIGGLSKEVKQLDKDSKLNNLVSELEKATDSGEEFEIILNKIKAELNNLEEEAQENMNLSVGTKPEQAKAIEQDIKLLHEQIDTQENLNEAIEAEEGSAKKALDGIKNASGAQATWADHVVNTANAIMALSAVVSSLNSLIDVWSNSDLSFWEKLESTLMSLSTIIPMVTIALDSETAAAVRAKLANNAYITSLKNTAIGAKIASLAVGGLASKLILILGVVGAVVLAGVGLVKLFQKIQDQSPEGQISKLNEELDNCQQAFDKVKTAAEETEEAINSLESGYDKIETLTKDTEEWARQVSNVNAEVLNLLETYPQLSKFLTEDENGLLSFQNGWKEYLNGRNDILKNSANNLAINKQNGIRAEEIKNSNTITSTNLDYVKEFKNNQDELFRLAQEFYANPEYGERLFTKEGSKDFYEALVKDGAITEQNTYGKNQIHNFLQSNSETLQNGYQQQQQINLIENSQLNSKLDLAQSNRNAEEALELLGISSYSTLMDNINKKVEEDFGEWQDYTAFTGLAQKEKIAEFAELKGLENVTYTGQSFGKMVFKDGEGQEHKFSKEEFFEGIGELYSIGEMQNLMANSIRENLTNIAGDAFSNIGDLEAINLDDVLLALQKNMGYEGEGYDKSLVNSLMGDAYGYDTEGIKQFTEDTQHIEWTTENTEKFKELLATFEQSTASDKVKTLTSEIRELNAAGQIKGMESTFTEAAERFGFDDDAAQQMHNYAKHLIEVADESNLLDDTLDENAETAADVAIAVTRMNRGIDTLADNFKDWNSVLKKSDKASAEYADAMSGVKGALSDVLGVESDLIDSDFVENHLDEIAKAATGDAAAIDALRESLATDILLEVTGKTNFEDVNSEIANLHNDILSMDNDIEVGATLDDEEFLTKAQELIEKSGMTVDQAQAYFNSLGYEPEFVTEEKTVKRSVPQEKTHTDYEITQGYVDIMGAQVPIPTIDRLTTTTIAGYKEMDEKIQVPAFGEDKPVIKSLTKTSSGAMNNYSSSNKGGGKPGKSGGGGGGGSKSKPAEKVKYTKKDEVVDRYKEINDTLSDIEETMSDINKQADRLYGASRISQMEKEKKLLLQQADALKTKKLQAENYMYRTSEIESQKGDKQKLVEAGAEVGITWVFDPEDGDILNYTSAMEGLYNELHAAEVKMDGMATKEAQDEFKESTVSKIEEKIEKVKEALSKYEDTKELMKELDNQLQEAIWAWQDKNFEVLEYKLELKLDIEDQDLQYLDYLMNKWSDDFFKLAESAALMYNSKGYDQVEGYGNQLENYREHEQALKKDYEAGNISQADYIEGLKNVRDGYYENLNALIELDKTMMHFYEDSLATGAEELADYTDHMEHLTGVFDHYLNLMDILGKSKDYEAMGDFLEGRAETLEDQLKVSKDYYEILVEDKAKIEKELNNALRSGSEEDKKYWKEQWDAIVDAVDEAQDQMLSLTEEWASAMKEVIQNNMTKLAEELEKALTGGIGFEFLMDEF